MNNTIANDVGKINQKKVLCFIATDFQFEGNRVSAKGHCLYFEEVTKKGPHGGPFDDCYLYSILLVQEAFLLRSRHVGRFDVCQSLGRIFLASHKVSDLIAKCCVH